MTLIFNSVRAFLGSMTSTTLTINPETRFLSLAFTIQL